GAPGSATIRRHTIDHPLGADARAGLQVRSSRRSPYTRTAHRAVAGRKGKHMAKDTADSASQLVDRLINDAQFRETVTAAPTAHARAEMVRADGYGDVSLDAIQEAVKERLTAVGAGGQADPERAKRAEELFLKAASDQELQQALQAAGTPEATRH